MRASSPNPKSMCNSSVSSHSTEFRRTKWITQSFERDATERITTTTHSWDKRTIDGIRWRKKERKNAVLMLWWHFDRSVDRSMGIASIATVAASYLLSHFEHAVQQTQTEREQRNRCVFKFHKSFRYATKGYQFGEETKSYHCAVGYTHRQLTHAHSCCFQINSHLPCECELPGLRLCRHRVNANIINNQWRHTHTACSRLSHPIHAKANLFRLYAYDWGEPKLRKTIILRYLTQTAATATTASSNHIFHATLSQPIIIIYLSTHIWIECVHKFRSFSFANNSNRHHRNLVRFAFRSGLKQQHMEMRVHTCSRYTHTDRGANFGAKRE